MYTMLVFETMCIICSGAFFLLSFGVMLIITKKKIHRKKNRRILVGIYDVLNFISLLLLILSALIIFGEIYLIIIGGLFAGFSIFFRKVEMVVYLTLTSSLVLIEPSMLFVFKFLRARNYEEKTKKLSKEDFEFEINEAQLDLADKIYAFVDALPLQGIIHIINLIFVVWANVIKIYQIEVVLTSNIIYMGVVTYYAIDKIISYLAKKYKDFWAEQDNKFFYTQEIKKNRRVDVFKMLKVVRNLLNTYVETGEYGNVNNICK